MKMQMTRRTFVGGFSAALAGGCRLWDEPTDRTYSVSVLGDTHFDAAPAEAYHAAFIREFAGTGRHRARFLEFERNAKIWAGPSRRIVEAGAASVRSDAAFLLQLGDLVQGDCNDPVVHRQMLDDMTRFVRGAYPAGLPFVTVSGNHDIRDTGQGAEAAYARYVKETLGHDATDFCFRQGPDIFFVFDFNDVKERKFATGPTAKTRLARQLKLLAENTAERYTFVVVHGGVIPFDSRGDRRWFYLGAPDLDVERRQMRALLAARNAIVLSGHTHHLELKDATFPEGRITEMTMNTVFLDGTRENPAEPIVLADRVEQYGRVLMQNGQKLTENLEPLYAEYRPYLTRYYLARGVGHAQLRVSDNGVLFDYFGHDSRVPTKIFSLR